MGNVRDQMGALSQCIAASARERQMAVGDSKMQTARMLQVFGRERAAMAKALKSRLVADREGRSGNVRAIRANTGTMRREFRQDHARMRRALRQRLARSTEAVATLVASLCADFAKGRADFAKAHRQATKAQRAGLAKNRRHRSREVAELMNNFHVSRGEMAHELGESLAKTLQRIESQVSGLKKGFRASLRETREDASAPGQIPDYLLAAQGGGAARAPSSALPREPEEHKEKKRVKTNTSATRTVRGFVGKPGKSKTK